MSMTTDTQLKNMAQKLHLKLNAVVYKERLQFLKSMPGNYIINMNDAVDGGSHWVALYLTTKQAFYFDSFGIMPPLDVIDFVKRMGIHLLVYSDA